MDNEKVPKSSEFFTCIFCDYSTSRRSQFDRHLSTDKHKMVINDNKKVPKSSVPLMCSCGKSYKHKSGLSRHKRICSTESESKSESESESAMCKILQNMVVSQNTVIELLKENAKTPAIMNHTTNNTQININMFLNEYCKDAITIGEFIESIQPTVEDVLYMTKHGNKQGLSKILTNALGQLEITERPLHCTDLKRHTTYIKQPDGWSKEKDQAHVKKICENVEHACMKKTLDILNSNPNYKKNGTKEYEEGIKMIMESNGDFDYTEIIKAVEETTHLQK